jgi:LPS export ABC transporter protein LptC
MNHKNSVKLLTVCVTIIFAALCATSCTEIEFLKSPSSTEEADNPSIVMNNIESNISNNGLLEKKVFAEKATYFENDQKALLEKIRVMFFDQGKESGTLTANNGTLFLADNKASKAAKNDLLLTGNIRYNGADGTLLETSRLYWDNSQQQLRGDTDYVRRKPVEGGVIETKGKQFRTNKTFTQWNEVGGTMRFISTQDTGKEQEKP